MKVLFVNPFFFAHSALERQFRTFYFPLGLLYLAAVAREAGHDVAVFDGTFIPSEEAFADALDAHQPAVVCIAGWVTVQPAALRLASTAGSRGVRVIVGGPGPTASPAAYLEHQTIDAAVMGEGERTLVDLLAATAAGNDLRGVAGLALLSDDGSIIRTPRCEPIRDLDSLPLPARDLIDVGQYLAMWEAEHGYRSLTLALTRGCPDESCPFCADSLIGAHHLRRRSVEDVVEEMRHLQGTYDVERFRLVDDLNRLERDWLAALGEAMIDAGVIVPYEGLNTVTHEDLPMLAQTRDICHERNAWIPTQGRHGHAPPTDDVNLLRRRWEDALLLDGEHLEDP